MGKIMLYVDKNCCGLKKVEVSDNVQGLRRWLLSREVQADSTQG